MTTISDISIRNGQCNANLHDRNGPVALVARGFRARNRASVRKSGIRYPNALRTNSQGQSARNACNGEIELARSAGITAAVSAEEPRTEIAEAIIIGSY